jgi:hypothetical protein
LLILVSVLVPVVIAIVGVVLANNARHQISRSLSTLPSAQSYYPNSPTSNVIQTPGAIAAPSPAAPTPPTVTPLPPIGSDLSASGINQNQTITCNGSKVRVSGISNKIVIKGHCASLDVSGVQNVVTVDAVDSIEVSGFTNQITNHSGSPDIDRSGDQNVVQQG